MRKLVVGIVAVALLGLLAVPAMAFLPVTETVEVEITVESYGAIKFSPSPKLELTVSGPLVTPVIPYCKDIDFTVLCNTNTILRLDAAEKTAATAAPGVVGSLYPTATGAIGEAIGHKIGFGVALKNISSTHPESDPWPNTTNPILAFVDVSFVLADVPVNLTDDNARITICSYMDSARDGDALAPPGRYDTTLILTLTLTLSEV